MATVIRPSYAAHWAAIHDQQDWALLSKQVHHLFQTPTDWSVNPEGHTGVAFAQYLAIRLWTRGGVPELAAYCLRIAHRDSEEALARKSFEAASGPDDYPIARHGFLVNKIFLDSFLGGGPLSKDIAIQIAKDQMTLAPQYGQRKWDAYPQSQYLHAIDLLLLTDQYALANDMLKAARSLNGRHVKELAQVTKMIAANSGTVPDIAQAASQYQATFDLLRNPNYADRQRGHPAFIPQLLTQACMYQKFLDSEGKKYSCDRAINMLWE